jgi:hypothetical protein
LALEQADDIRLTSNLQLTKPYTLTGDMAIDLNGNTLSSSVSAPLFEVNGKVTLKGGSASTRGQLAKVENGGELTVQNGTYVSSSADVIRVGTNGTVIINGGELTGREGAVSCRDGGSTVVINNGALVGTDNFALATNGSNGMGNNVIELNGGKLEGNITSPGWEAIGVYVANDDIFVMNDGEIIANGGTGLCMRAGDVTINGGKITATNVDKNGNIVADGKIGDDPTVMEGCSAIIYHETANYPGKEGMKLTIKGGTITGVDHSLQVLSNEALPQVFVTGGTLTPAYPEG